jgi:hypothetical protein
MNCRQCRKSLVPYLEKVPGAPAAEIERHLAECDACRGEAAAVRALRDRMIQLGEAEGAARSIEPTVMDRIARHSQQKQEGEPMMTIRKRLFAHPWRLSAASIVFAALVGAALILVGRGNRYAFAQTVEAHRNVRSVHVHIDTAARLQLGKDGAFSYPAQSGTTEVWIEIGEDGRPVRLRADTAWSGDGPYTVFWQEDKASVWLVSKNVFWTFKDTKENVVSRMPKEILDPNSIVKALEERLAAGKAQITKVKRTYESPFDAKVLVVNPPEPEGMVEVFVIDSKTKLLQEFEKYKKKGTELEFAERFRFTEYNEPIAASIFAPALPADVIRLDQSNRDLGVAQGKMTDSEVCEAAVRQFFECLIAKDYDKAAAIWPGWGSDALKERNALSSVGKIISIGPAKPDVRPSKESRILVPYEVEWRDGRRWSGTAEVKPWEGQPGRWVINGGI